MHDNGFELQGGTSMMLLPNKSEVQTGWGAVAVH
jgi:hypothetical protein